MEGCWDQVFKANYFLYLNRNKNNFLNLRNARQSWQIKPVSLFAFNYVLIRGSHFDIGRWMWYGQNSCYNSRNIRKHKLINMFFVWEFHTYYKLTGQIIFVMKIVFGFCVGIIDNSEKHSLAWLVSNPVTGSSSDALLCPNWYYW